MAKKKRKIAPLVSIILILAVIVVLIVAIPKLLNMNNITDIENEDLGIIKDDPNDHGEGFYELDEPENTDEKDKGEKQEHKQYMIYCRFEGKIDKNAFEVTELNFDQSGNAEEKLLQLRIGNDSVRQDVDVLEIGERFTVQCHYNSYSQIIADRIMFSADHKED